MADKPTKFYSTKQEKLIAKELGGYPIGGSGAAPCAPGDVRTYDWLVECKTHTEPDHSIFFSASVWSKIKNEATGMHRKPVLIVDDGSQTVSRTWCLCKSSHLNLGNAITVDLPVAVKKNITCKHDKLSANLKAESKRYIGDFYKDSLYEVQWEGDSVVVMPFKLFKEIFEK